MIYSFDILAQKDTFFFKFHLNRVSINSATQTTANRVIWWLFTILRTTPAELNAPLLVPGG